MSGHGITCAMRPHGAIIRDLERLGIDKRQKKGLADLLNEVTAVDALANLLDEALVATTKGNGTLDLRAVATYVIKTLREHQL